ncbi:tetratricopeptide repeat protein [Litoreibacter ponti]|uniref:Tetratricopeptide repeat protein n=1 Tax=Litoreibacter ponti TaxID=1510457 RepID=A0A2T6BKB1_9RHOB|nr:tetratricopeptide repeat protein [Litoreibacter ponti]PTX56507.1 tetratricopeptide repeat protein [Litoreibacter ponti]
MPRTILFATALICLPALAFAAGSGSSAAPTSTKTASDCKAGQVFDQRTKSCLDSKSDLIDDDARYEAVRELAYDGQYDRALKVLASMSDQSESRVLTYYGFITRKQGDMAGGFAYYTAALEADADNILARSYMGQAMVQLGQIGAARAQLAEIRSRGGDGTWAEASLSKAIATGATFNY